MKGYKWIAGLLTCFALTSCFKEEPLNAECDIEQVFFHVDNPTDVFFSVSDTLQNVRPSEDVITFNVRRKSGIDLATLKPQFKLTPGAQLVELEGGTMDSEKGGTYYYETLSEDKQWKRRYRLNITPTMRTVNDTVKYDFEHFELEPKDKKYYVWHNVLEDGTFGNDWSNGNPGFRIARPSAQPSEYPSAPMENGFDGHAIQLTTRSTGFWGAMSGKPIAAGNFFLGTFDESKAIWEPMNATQFGIPFDREPLVMTGVFKYQPGPIFKDKKGTAMPDRKDSAAIYAVLYYNTEEIRSGNNIEHRKIVLNGENVKTSPNIVAIADMKEVPVTDSWTPFRLDFVYKKPIDYDVLLNRGYNLAIVFSSSNKGDRFEGAIGSQLCIDQIRIICKKEE